MPLITVITPQFGTTRRTAITDPVVDPLIEPFLTVHLNYREAIRKTLAPFSDADLSRLLVLFNAHNLRNIPAEFWAVAPRVRTLVQKEQAARKARQASLEALTGDTPE